MKTTRRNPPIIYVLAGPNGAGKTTFAAEFLPEFVRCREFLNADLIAAGLAPFAPEMQNLRAGRLLLERIRELAAQKVDLAFETTMSGRTCFKMLRDLKADGYRVELFFLLLSDAATAVARVQNRVRQGGHHVPPEVIRRRYAAGLRNLVELKGPLVDAWWLFDSSTTPPAPIASKQHDRSAARRLGQARKGTIKCKDSKRKSSDQDHGRLAKAAFLQASYKVVERAIQTGTPVITWREGKVVEIDPRTIRLPKLPAAKPKGKRKS